MTEDNPKTGNDAMSAGPYNVNEEKKSPFVTGSPYVIPGAILLAGVLVSGAILYSGLSGSVRLPVGAGGVSVRDNGQLASVNSASAEKVRPVRADDHIRGSVSALVKIIEFSDLECPFCKRFHSSMQFLMEEYGASGEVAWVYRHFPLDSIHSKARKEAEAAECADELGGNDAFWKYIDRFFEITPSNNNTDLSILPDIAEHVGLDRDAFLSCLSEGKHATRVEKDLKDAISSGGTGTPYSIIVAPNGKKFPLLGAQSYAALKPLVDLALQEK